MAIKRIIDNKECPIYWKNLGMPGLAAYSKGQGVKLAIVDTCIFKNHNIFHPKSIIMQPSQCNIPNKAPTPELAHGTAMASLIVGLPRKGMKAIEDSQSNKFDSVCGIANKAKLFAYNKNEGQETGFWNLQLSKKKISSDLFPSPSPVELHVMSYSLGSHKKSDWINKLNKVCNSGGLLIAAAGNNGLDLNDKKNEVYPAKIKLNETTCKYEPRIIVANQDQENNYPVLNLKSNYGSNYVHIAAPGTDIPQATPHFEYDKNDEKYQNLISPATNYYIINSGTSQATAIVSATAALIMKCNLHISAIDLRNIILNTATIFEPLKDKIENGRILCTRPAVEKICLKQQDSEINVRNVKSPAEALPLKPVGENSPNSDDSEL
jgi:subtilisin family serine protease